MSTALDGLRPPRQPATIASSGTGFGQLAKLLYDLTEQTNLLITHLAAFRQVDHEQAGKDEAGFGLDMVLALE
jgi:hypothetical protein